MVIAGKVLGVKTGGAQVGFVIYVDLWNIECIKITEGIFRDLFYGEGRVDMEGSVKTLYSMGVRRYNAEFWYDGGENWRERLSDANDYLRKYLDKEVRAE